MKIDIMFLVSARMGFRCRMKSFHYSLFLKERLGKIQIIRLMKLLLQCTTVTTPKKTLPVVATGTSSYEVHTKSEFISSYEVCVYAPYARSSSPSLGVFFCYLRNNEK